MLHLDYRDARPIYTQICDGIRDQILSGILRQGDKLPSVRDLATQLTINPNTIQRSYRELEMQGWVASVAGKGCFVCGIPGDTQDRERQLWSELEAAAQKLKALGISPEEIARHLTQGGNEHA